MIAQSECAMLFSERIRLLQNTILLTRENHFLKLSLISTFIYLLCLFFIQQFCNIGQIELWNKNIFHVIKAIDYKLVPYQKMQCCFRGESGYRKTN